MRPIHLLRPALALWLALPGPAATLVLKRKFVEEYKNRATIEVSFTIEHAKKSVNTIGKGGEDGDLHVAGRAPKVGLPMVAEVVNAKGQQSALGVIRKAEGTEQPIPLAGVWRIWFEHPGKQDHIQGQPVPAAHNTNPDHVFEIHPITRVGDVSAAGSFVPITGYKAYGVDDAFARYEELKATIRATKTAVTIDAKMAGYNYAEFGIEISGAPKKFDDCTMALATVLDNSGDPAFAALRRMVFLKGMAKESLIKKGAQLRVLGIPRVNLERLAFLIADKEGQTLADVPLPYEMIIVGIVSP